MVSRWGQVRNVMVDMNMSNVGIILDSSNQLNVWRPLPVIKFDIYYLN